MCDARCVAAVATIALGAVRCVHCLYNFARFPPRAACCPLNWVLAWHEALHQDLVEVLIAGNFLSPLECRQDANTRLISVFVISSLFLSRSSAKYYCRYISSRATAHQYVPWSLSTTEQRSSLIFLLRPRMLFHDDRLFCLALGTVKHLCS